MNAGTQLAQIESAARHPVAGAADLVRAARRLSAGREEDGRARARPARLCEVSKPRRFDRNLVVIGAGSAGLVSAYIAAAVKAKVTLIEKHRMGGDCLNTGCVPSKALIRSAKLLADVKRVERARHPQRNRRVRLRRRDGARAARHPTVEPHDSVERYTELGVECLPGTRGSPRRGRSRSTQPSGTRTLTTRASSSPTGARPFVPPIPGIEKARCVTSDTVWDLRKLPRAAGGAGRRADRLRAGAVLRAPRLAGDAGRDGAAHPDARRSRGLGDGGAAVARRRHRMLTRPQGDAFEADGGRQGAGRGAATAAKCASRSTCCCARSAACRTPRATGSRSSASALTKQRTVETNEYLQTIYPNIYACGDVAGPYQFTHTASHQAWYAAVNALFGGLKKFRADYSVIPWARSPIRKSRASA